MHVYANGLEPINNTQLYLQLAEYFNIHQNKLMAGKFYGLAKKYNLVIYLEKVLFLKALENFIQSNNERISTSKTDFEDDSAIQLAVDFVSKSEDKSLIHKLIDYLMGEMDGYPKVFLKKLFYF